MGKSDGLDVMPYYRVTDMVAQRIDEGTSRWYQEFQASDVNGVKVVF
jgi:hypothetical protein